MSNIPESNTWEEVRQWETSDPALGGTPDTLFVTPVKNLVNRTKYLKELVDDIVSGDQEIVGHMIDGSTVDNSYESVELVDNAVANTLYVAAAIALKAGRRNMLLNGAMNISQRGDTFVLGAGECGFTLDRWWAKCASGSGDTITVLRDNALLQGLWPGFKYCMKLQFAATSTSLELRQRIMNGRTFEGQKATLQFYLSLTNNCNIAAKVSRFLNQEQIDNNTPEWTTSETINGTTGRSSYAVTFTVPDIITNVAIDPDDDGCFELSLTFQHSSGSSLVAGIMNIQLEPGAITSRFEERDDLPECLTYFEKSLIYERYDRTILADGIYGIPAFYTRQYWTAKRKKPTLTTGTASLINVESIELYRETENGCTLKWQPTSETTIVNYREVDVELLIDAEI